METEFQRAVFLELEQALHSEYFKSKKRKKVAINLQKMLYGKTIYAELNGQYFH